MQIHVHIERIILPFRNPDLQTHVIFNMLLKEWEGAIPSKFNFLHVNQRKMSVSRKSGVFFFFWGGGSPSDETSSKFSSIMASIERIIHISDDGYG